MMKGNNRKLGYRVFFSSLTEEYLIKTSNCHFENPGATCRGQKRVIATMGLENYRGYGVYALANLVISGSFSFLLSGKSLRSWRLCEIFSRRPNLVASSVPFIIRTVRTEQECMRR